jgi:hemoglobin
LDTIIAEADEEAVAELVAQFYGRIRADERLGSIFEKSVSDWDGHLKVMRDFWSAVLLGTDRYRGCVMSSHFGLPLVASDLDRFLELFRPTALETLPPTAATRAIAAAESVIQGMRRMVR